MLGLQVAGHVWAKSQQHGGVVILDTSAGQVLALNHTAGDLWRSWESGAGFDKGVDDVAGQYPEVPRDAIRADARQLLDELVVRGLIDPVPTGGSGAIMAEPTIGDAGPRAGWLRVFIALVTLAAGMLVRYSFRASFALVRSSRRRWCNREPASLQAAGIVAAVARAARWYPGRAACLEQSLAAVLLAAATRRRLTWCIGSVPDPYQFHAWVSIQGQPVPAPGESASLRESYIPILEI
jgi:hypothetical protein